MWLILNGLARREKSSIVLNVAGKGGQRTVGNLSSGGGNLVRLWFLDILLTPARLFKCETIVHQLESFQSKHTHSLLPM
jgi:hypothetical protein